MADDIITVLDADGVEQDIRYDNQGVLGKVAHHKDEALNTVAGLVADAAIDTDTTGSLSGKMRGLVKLTVNHLSRIPAALGRAAAAASLPVAIATEDLAKLTDMNTILGTTADAAVSTDANGTLSAKARGFIVLMVNFLTRIPAALTGSGNFKVAVQEALPAGSANIGSINVAAEPVYTTVATGELAGNTSATQLPNVTCRAVQIKAVLSNAGNVYIGISGVTRPNGSDDVTTGLELTPGDSTGWLPVDNLNRLYRICDNAGDDLTYLAVA